jgi:class 3 adenylate cyclase/tetratricopeptide (TPR) repeat protein
LPGSRVVTLLFTDLVSSTEISQRLGDDAADDFRRSHYRLLRDAVALHHGEEVKNLGDGLMVVFDSPSDAVACSIAMQQSVEQHGRKHAESFGLRVGLHTGEVTPDEGDYFGIAVVIAERLCKLAGPGQTLASDVLRLIVGPRGTFSFSDLGPLELKGVTDPVGGVEVLWEPIGTGTTPLPHALAVVDTNPFVGRDVERQKLLDALKLARSGERQLVFIVGEPGMGKSRLCTEFAQDAHAAGAIVLYGRCDEETLAPYQPFVELLRHYVSVCGAEELSEQVAPLADELVRLVPDLARRIAGVGGQAETTDADTDRLRLFDAVRALLGAISRTQPVVLVLDDVHWADRPTLHLLRHLLRSEPFPALIVATYRETDLDRTHPLSAVLADLRREQPFERLHLKGLDTAEILLALEKGAGQPVGHRGVRLAEALSRATDGNPFFLIQILGHLTDTGRIYEQDGVWTFDVHVDDLEIPEGVKEVIGRRISALSEQANHVLGVASVLGREFSLDILELVSDTAAGQILDALDEAIRAQIVQEILGAPGRFRFAHALVRETLYEELTAARRVRLHRHAAGVFESLSPDDPDRFVSELAYHLLEAAQVAEVDKTVQYASRAAARATSLFAFEEAIRLYERALGALELREEPDEPTRFDLVAGLGDAQWNAGDSEGATASFATAITIADALGDNERYAIAAVGASGLPEYILSDFKGGAVHRQLERALSLLPKEDSVLRARVCASLATVLALDQTEAEQRAALVEESMSMAKRLGDPRTIAYAMRAAVIALFDPSQTEAQLAFANELISYAEEIGDRELVGFGHGWRSIMLFWLEDLEESDRELAVTVAINDELKMPLFTYLLLVLDAARRAMRGAISEAERLATEALEIGQGAVGAPAALVVYGVQLLAIRWVQGRIAELEPLIRGQLEQFPMLPTLRCTLAYIAADSGRMDEAREEFEYLAQTGFALPADATRPAGLARLCILAWMFGDLERAGQLYELFTPFLGCNVAISAIISYGSADRYLALCASTMSNWELAERHFRAAIEQNERMGAAPFVAFSKHEYAEMLMRRGEGDDLARARMLLDDALAIARDVGMPALIDQIQMLQT